MQTRINIIGSGISGLFTAYFLGKHSTEGMKIEIYDSQNKAANNASTNSLTWLNALYPCKDNNTQTYDQYRIESIRAWQDLIETLSHDGITGISPSREQCIQIEEQDINSLHVFFDLQQENNHINSHKRLEHHAENLHTNNVDKNELVKHFPFIANLPEQIIIHNVAYEQLINPSLLRMKLINFLEKNNVIFHWNTAVTSEMIQTDSSAHWIIAAGAGCVSLIKESHTELKQIQFSEHSIGELIYCKLTSPLDLKGKVFHFSSTETTPGFHLCNDENDITKLKIVLVRQTGKKSTLEQTATAIFSLLKISVQEYSCTDKIVRPVTHDARPLVEMKLGAHKNIHLIYGHSLFTNAASIYPCFANHLANVILNKSVSEKNISRLDQFSSDRFIQRGQLHNISGIYQLGQFSQSVIKEPLNDGNISLQMVKKS